MKAITTCPCKILLAVIISLFAFGTANACTAEIGVSDNLGNPVTDLTVCQGTQLVFENASGGIINLTTWSLNGLAVSTLLNHQITFDQQGIFTVKLSILEGTACTDETEVVVTVLGDPGVSTNFVPPLCPGNCDGQVGASLTTEFEAYYGVAWLLDGDPAGSGLGVNGVCAGIYDLVITDEYGCTDLSIPVEVSDPPLIEVSIFNGTEIEICPGDGAIELEGGTNLDIFLAEWTGGEGISDPFSLSPIFTPTPENLNRAYTLTITDGNGCTQSTDIQILAKRGDLVGEARYDGEPCEGCAIECYKLEGAGIWEPWVTTTSFSGGLYELGSIRGLIPCIMRVVPPAGSGLPAMYFNAPEPTHRWDHAMTIITGCGPDDVVVKDVFANSPPPLSGSTTVSGALYKLDGGKVQAEDPIPGVDVVVEKVPPGNARTTVQTDSEGRFIFDFLEQTLGDTVYHFYVDMCGLPMESTHIFSISAEDDLIEGLDLCIDEDVTRIAVCSITGVVHVTGDGAGGISMFPNPASDEVVVTTGTGSLSIVSVEMRDITGRTVRSLAASEARALLPVGDVPSGLYVVTVTLSDGSSRSERLVVGH